MSAMTSGLRLITTESVFLTRISSMDKKRSPQPPRTKLKTHLSHHTNASDSDASVETNSLSADSANEHPKELTQTNSTNRKKFNRRRGSEWEILEGLKDGQRFDKKPEAFNGYLHKKRKWPLKGWHKRYFVLDKGILIYAKSPGDIARGKKHGSVDIGLSVISTKDKRRRIDIDAEEFIYHLKAKTIETFNCWVQQLKAHRLYRHHILTYGLRDVPLIRATNDDDTPVCRTNLPLTPPEIVSRDGSLTRGLKAIGSSNQTGGSGRLAAWVIDSGPSLDQAHREVTQVQQNIAQLTRILEHIDASSHCLSTSLNAADSELAGEAYSPNVKKDRKKFGLRKKKSSKGSSVDLTSTFCPNKLSDPENASPLSANSFSGLSPQTQALSASNSSLAAIAMTTVPIPVAASRPQSLPGTDHLAPLGTSMCDRQFSGTPDHQLREDFTILAKDVISNLKSVVFALVTERDRLKAALDSDAANPVAQNVSGPNSNVVAQLRNNLNQVLQQNSELKSRLARVHDVSDLSDVSSVGPASEIQCRPFNASLSYSSSCVSASEFFDAEELPSSGVNLTVPNTDRDRDRNSSGGGGGDVDDHRHGDGSDTSSEAGSLTSEEGSVSSESELGHDYIPVNSLTEIEDSEIQNLTGRRTKLPVPRPDTEGLSLWNLLCKNIGKDLSQISMPVALNEPLNMLQRLCEELEYSELLDKAAELDDPYERMVHVAAFAVSSYASSCYRAGNKPFNPLLGETYECIREDKGFKFLSEQVSHHPPVSVCYAESKNFIFWQDARIKTKFWGKSMEFQPLGQVNLQLPKCGDLYQWNKITTCVHNLFSGQRWVDQYGELKITNGGITCKLTFAKASYWSAKRHEIYGAITNEDGKVVRKLFGKWSEALYCGVAPSAKCIWRPGTMPEDYEMYYGFTRFATELNELDPETAKYLPPTDTRFRPDQRALEEGDLDAAENLKLQLEQMQRERRKRIEMEGIQHQPKWFSKKMSDVGENWEFNGKYWEYRKSPGFTSLSFEPLWCFRCCALNNFRYKIFAILSSKSEVIRKIFETIINCFQNGW